MRTTLTIDDDVAKLLQEEATRSGDTFKGTVNDVLRRGLLDRRKPQRKKRFVVKPLPLNTGLGTRYDKVADLIEAMEGPLYR
ncbi:hypothetical protein [Terracidiphilus gabretensis]|uniref:hypothetical protein n=1 Tax=Terracidiphilus gabretensis TaxID=1577687 RepID=UPI00071BE960|nr:hypothetical protein [Terracidiphilus gabretensis]